MANLYSEQFEADMEAMRRTVRRSAHAERTRAMLIAAVLSAFGLVAVAATLLTSVI